MLFLCGLPGGYPDDLIDVDLEALEGDGVIRVSNADYLARPLRLTPDRGDRDHRGAPGAARRRRRRDPRRRRPGPGQARGGRGRGTAAGRPRGRRTLDARPPRPARGRRTPGAAGAPDLLRAGARRGVRAGRRPAPGRVAPRRRLPRRVVPQRRCAAAVPPRPDPRGEGPRQRGRHRAGPAARPVGRDVRQRRGGDAGDARPAPRGPLDRGVLRDAGGAACAPTAAPRSICSSGDEQWLQRLLLRLAPYAAGGRAPRTSPAARPRRSGRLWLCTTIPRARLREALPSHVRTPPCCSR